LIKTKKNERQIEVDEVDGLITDRLTQHIQIVAIIKPVGHVVLSRHSISLC
jgi:hypothetical protein